MTGNGPIDPGAAIAGLSRMVEVLERRITPLERLPEQLARLAALGAPGTAPAIEPAPTWLAGVRTTGAARQLLVDLDEWVRAVFLAYGDTATFPRECWAWHLDVVEELLWLQATWLLAYDTEGARPTAAADWHDRYRPNAVRRICGGKGTRGAGYAGGCSIENHQGTRRHIATPTPAVDDRTLEVITRWRTTDRDAPAPEVPGNTRQHTP